MNRVGPSKRQQETSLTGLREKQKADRRKRIIDAAKQLFAQAGHDNTTIEAIADAAGVSGVTVHNYYGTKSGVLLALVAESDRELVEKIGKRLPGKTDNLLDLTLLFAEIIRDHAITKLEKSIWRQVIAALITTNDPRFGKSYHGLDHQLALALVREIGALQTAGKVSPDVSAYDLGKALFQLQNMRFIQFISSDDIGSAAIGNVLRNDLRALFAAHPVKD